MHVTEELLHKLSRLAENDRTILSVYLDTRRGWEPAEKFIESESRRLAPALDAEEEEYFDASISFLTDYINGKKSAGFDGPGIAFFADLGADFAGGIELTVPPELMLAVDDEAHILPLALELDEYEPVGIIMADASGARIFIAAGQILEDEDSLKTKIHHLSKVGGWSQMRYQRRRDKQVKHFAGEVAAAADSVFHQAHIGRILMAGREQILNEVKNELSKQWQDAVIAVVKWDLDAGEDEFIAKIAPVLERAEREQEQELLGRFTAEIRRNGLAVAGVEKTLAAAKLGQADTIILENDIDGDLAGELTSLAGTTSAYVEFVPPGNDILAANDGVGAILRYKIRQD